ncbi:efflux RND transporter periplasmic adaptor subunit [Arenicella chitinivorans]|uniref:efflux RND transporter periplasmic adaptor subunit n=1 Tax=Arenicella chitinivorans TaxID=1329800 RepID=UPI001E5490CB|nr:efflux RND transporter periplasmic adaptor subunit [Arenicella chitinivorans]
MPIFFKPRLKIVLVIGLVVLGGIFLLSEERVESGAKPFLSAITRGDIESTITAAGSLQPSSYVDVGVQVSGEIDKLYVDVGDVVTQGQLLAEIDATVQTSRVAASRASLDALKAQLAARQASLKLAQANADRQTRLIKAQATSQADFDAAISALVLAQSSLAQLESQISQSEASLASDEATLAFSRIEAPMSGTVISISMKEGQTLNATQQAPTLLRIANLAVMTVEGEVSEADVNKLTAEMPVYFTTLGGGERRWHGRLRQILPEPEVTNNVVLYTALFDVDNHDGALLPNMTAQIFFVTASAQDVIRVPVGALDFDDTDNLLNLKLPAQIIGEPRTRSSAESNLSEGLALRSPLTDARPDKVPERGAPITPEQRAQFRARRAAAGGRGAGNRRRAPLVGNNQSEARPATVVIAHDDGRFERRPITIGVTTRVSAEVIDGLEVGDKVVAGVITSNGTTQSSARNTPRVGGGRPF